MAQDSDWYPTTQARENEMYKAIFANIDAVNATLGADVNTINRFKDIAGVFIDYYKNINLNEAAIKALNQGFKTVRKGKKGTDPMPVPPVFHPLVLPAGDFVGLVEEVRGIRRYLTGLMTWSNSMGDILRMNGRESTSKNPDEMSPSVEIGKIEDKTVTLTAPKEGTDATEYQWREAGEENWNPLIVSGERTTTIKIPTEKPAAKIELRAHFQKKYKRTGNWSPTYNFAVGD